MLAGCYGICLVMLLVLNKSVLSRLWRDVTEALKNSDVDSATAEKHKVKHNRILFLIVVTSCEMVFSFGCYVCLIFLSCFSRLLINLQLEERQRAEARERKEKGEKWQTKVF